MAGPPGLLWIDNRHSDIYPSTDPAKTDLSQPGKVVLITGAGRGIGRSTALCFARCGVGAIVICARTLSELNEVEQSIMAIDSKIRVHKFTVDVSDEASVSKVAEAVQAAETKLDVLINNAGTSPDWLPIADSKDDWWRCYEVNVKGVYLMTKYFVRMVEKGGMVINVSSVGAEVVMPGASSYQTGKLAVLRLTEFTQIENGHLTCVAIHPGGVLTAMSEKNAFIRDYCIDTPQLAAGFMAWLTKGDNTWLAGRFLYSNWDVDELVKRKEDIIARDLLKMRLAL